MNPSGSIEGITDADIDEVVGAVVSTPVSSSEWTGRDLFVAFPCYKTTNPVTAWCLVAIALDFGKEKVRFDMELGDAMIYHARNRLAQRFLESPAKWILFVDDDMILPIGRPDFLRVSAKLPSDYPVAPTALNTVNRLISHGKELVGASYVTRNVTSTPVNSLMRDPQYRTQLSGFVDQIVPCDWFGTGCMLVHRRVFEEMQRKMPELAPSVATRPWDFFRPDSDEQGEDQAFCRRAREIGVQPYVDTMLQALHVGYGVYGAHTLPKGDVL
jgi:hypothetical protein